MAGVFRPWCGCAAVPAATRRWQQPLVARRLALVGPGQTTGRARAPTPVCPAVLSSRAAALLSLTLLA